MSAITSRPRIVRLPPDLLAVANTNACLASEVFEPLVSAHPDLMSIAAGSIVPTATGPVLQDRFEALQNDALAVLSATSSGIGPHDVALATAAALAGAGYMIDNRVVEPALNSVREADSCADALRRARALAMRAEADHLRAIQQGLAEACARASVQAGFGDVEICRGSDGAARVLATNSAGKALVSEIRVPGDRPASLATEVLGVSDGSCQGILDRFDAALDATGITGAAVERRTTGGVPELRAAKESIRRLLHRRCQISKKAPSYYREENDNAGSHRRTHRKEKTTSHG